jgi:RNA polymerase sigma-70 factor (ECF subfamily)
MLRALSREGGAMAVEPIPTAAPVEIEAALGRQLAAGDRVAAERLVERTYGRIFGALVKLCDGDADEAADLTQETYRKAWQSLASFRADCLFSTWLYRIAYNTFLNHRRRPRALRLDEDAGPEPRDPARTVEELVAESEVAAHLRRAVHALPEPLRFAVTARYWGGLSSPEIARLEGLSSVGVRKRLLRALALLDQTLTPKDH